MVTSGVLTYGFSKGYLRVHVYLVYINQYSRQYSIP